MKKILVALLVVGLAGVYSCSKNDPGVQPPSTFGEVTTPSATITMVKKTFNVSETINFSASVKNTGSYSWDFGDGSSPSTQASPSHAYQQAKVYTVKLTVFSTDKGHKYTATTKVVVGTRYFDSAVLVQIPLTDTTGNGWRTDFKDPTVGFNFKKASASTYEMNTTNYWLNIDPKTAPFHRGYYDNTAAHIITPEVWQFDLLLAQSDAPPSGISVMHGWTRDMSREADNPMILRGSKTGFPFVFQIYWSVK